MIRAFCIFTLVVVSTLGEAEIKKVVLQDVYETCKRPFVTENYKPNWEKDQGVNENSTIYFPLMSKSAMFRIAQQLYKTVEFEEFKEQHLANSCMRLQKDVSGSVWTFKGYNDKSFIKYLNSIIGAPNSYVFPPSFTPGVGGRVYVSLSDNKSFTVWVTCHDDGVGCFIVSSPERTLPSTTLDIVREHVKALGFKEENFLEPNSDLDCDSPLEDVPTAKNLTVPLFLSNVVLVPGYRNVLVPWKK